jgi:hypothetical protein
VDADDPRQSIFHNVYASRLPVGSRSGSPLLTAVSRQLPSCHGRIHRYHSCSASHLSSVGFLDTAALQFLDFLFLTNYWVHGCPHHHATFTSHTRHQASPTSPRAVFHLRHLTLYSPHVFPLPRAYALITRSLAVCPRAGAEPPNHAYRRRNTHTLPPPVPPVHHIHVHTMGAHGRFMTEELAASLPAKPILSAGRGP